MTKVWQKKTHKTENKNNHPKHILIKNIVNFRITSRFLVIYGWKLFGPKNTFFYIFLLDTCRIYRSKIVIFSC